MRSSAGLICDLVDLVLLGQDRHGAGGSVNASLCLGRRHALHAMGAGLEFQPRERAAAGNAADDLLVATVLAGAFAEYLGGEALRFRVARVHAVELAGEDRRLIAAGAGADLEEDAALVARIARQQQLAQLLLLRLEAPLEPHDLLVPEGAHAGVGVALQLARSDELALQAVVEPHALGQRLQARILDRQVAELRRAPGDLGAREQPADLLEPVGELLQALADGFLHGCSIAEARRGCRLALPRGRRAQPQPILGRRHSPGYPQFVTSCAMRGSFRDSIVSA